jgi:hypothetical protein
MVIVVINHNDHAYSLSEPYVSNYLTILARFCYNAWAITPDVIVGIFDNTG